MFLETFRCLKGLSTTHIYPDFLETVSKVSRVSVQTHIYPHVLETSQGFKVRTDHIYPDVLGDGSKVFKGSQYRQHLYHSETLETSPRTSEYICVGTETLETSPRTSGFMCVSTETLETSPRTSGYMCVGTETLETLETSPRTCGYMCVVEAIVNHQTTAKKVRAAPLCSLCKKPTKGHKFVEECPNNKKN
eukprot:Seg1123.2 transcript_id=Seg1123.2/GoldUCD/mRNA.D3Y31 product="hypothetical protein" protein_id=Seg1123.2/GoldUCD/D3Y31